MDVQAGRRGALKSAPVACWPGGGLCVCVWWAGGGGIVEGKSAGMQPNPLGIPLFSVAHQSPNDTSSLLYNPMIPGLVTKAGTRGRHRRTHSICMCTLHSEERCLRYRSQDGRCWLMSRGGLYHFPAAFYFNTGKSS